MATTIRILTGTSEELSAKGVTVDDLREFLKKIDHVGIDGSEVLVASTSEYSEENTLTGIAVEGEVY